MPSDFPSVYGAMTREEGRGKAAALLAAAIVVATPCHAVEFLEKMGYDPRWVIATVAGDEEEKTLFTTILFPFMDEEVALSVLENISAEVKIG